MSQVLGYLMLAGAVSLLLVPIGLEIRLHTLSAARAASPRAWRFRVRVRPPQTAKE